MNEIQPNVSQLNMPVQNQPNVSQLNMPVQNQRIVKFILPKFNPADTKTWFAAVEHIFHTNGVNSEEERFSSLLQHLDSSDLSHICDMCDAKDRWIKNFDFCLRRG